LTPIQAILLILILALGILVLRRSHSRLTGRIVMILFIIILSLFVLFPDITTWIANLVGVGRGTDFLFYTFALFVLYALSLTYLRLRDQDKKITQATRSMAIQTARQPEPQQAGQTHPQARIHPTAEVAPDAKVGAHSSIWHHSQVRSGAQIGENCILGKGVYVDAEVTIGNNVKIQNYVSVYHGVTVEDGVFIGPHVCFTNDLQPRAINPDGTLKAADDWILTPTRIQRGAALGANSTIRCGITVGEWAMVGAGSVVTHDVPAYGLVYGNPARLHGFVCPCGSQLKLDPDRGENAGASAMETCPQCGRVIDLGRDAWKGIMQ
jgi:UDP-2-acetamido-3-amino-2,3-dideoxy-glucuronate N-acetyltransferase